MTFTITAEGTIEIGNRASSRPDGNRDANVSTSNYPMNDVAAGALIGKIRYRDGRFELRLHRIARRAGKRAE